ncbi:MAG: hypothetical protein N2449_05070 [Bacteroidales bacterium]|nr:hypothetical protein [Bacteroidales bacterium]
MHFFSISIFIIYSFSSILHAHATCPKSETPILAPRFKFYYENNHNFYIESGYFLGKYNGPRISVNYDGIVRNYQYLIFSLRIGAGYSFAEHNSQKQEFIFPMSIHIQYTRVNRQAGGFRRYNIRNIFQRFMLKSNIDFAIGGYNYANKQLVSPFFSIGLRRQNPEGGWMYRFAVDFQLDNVFSKNYFQTSYYGPILSLGYTF